MYITRKFEKLIKEALSQFPLCLITGPRQAGKSTLLQNCFKDYKYVNLDDPLIRDLATEDPELFLHSYETPLIIDEIQYAPDLFIYIKILVDKDRSNYGSYLLASSQTFQVMEGVSESLAGRVAIFNLYPLSYQEIQNNKNSKFSLSEPEIIKHMIKGCYPEFYNNPNMDPNLWYSSYLATYIERDVRNIKAITDLKRFQTFIQLLASRVGQLLNISEIAKECGITQPTAKNWISILESTYIIYLLKPYYKNLSKRLVKSPKVYFVDTGLLCYLLGIDTPSRFLKVKERGSIFENMVVIELLKRLSYQTKSIPMYFYRTSSGLEVDLIIDKDQTILPFEIKFAKTLKSSMCSNLEKFLEFSESKRGYLVSLNENKVSIKPNISTLNWMKIY